MDHSNAVPEALQAIIDMLKANKHTREKGKSVVVGPDWNAIHRAAEIIFKIAKFGEYPKSSADLEKFTKTLDVKAIEARTGIVKSGEDIEYLPTVTPKFVSLNPVNFSEESISRLSPVDGSVRDQKPGNDVANDQRAESANLGEVERTSDCPSLEEAATLPKERYHY